MLQISAHQTADVQVFGLARHLCADTADTTDDHINADTGAAGFLQLENDIAVRDGVVFQDHRRRTAQPCCGDDMIHLVQQHALEPQRGHQHLFAGFGQLLNGKILEDIGGFFTDLRVCRNERVIRIEFTGFFVVVPSADLGDVGIAILILFGNEGQLGVDLVIIKAINDGTACLFQLLGPVDIVLLVKAGTQLHKSNHFLAVFGGFHQRLHDLRFPRHPVERHLDGNDLRVLCRLFQHGNKRPDGLIRIAEKHIVLFHFCSQVILRRRKHGTGRRVEQLRVAISFHAGSQLIKETQIQRAVLRKHPLVAQFQTAAENTRHFLRGRRRDLQADSGQFAAALEQVGHDLAVINVMVHHALFDVDIRIARHTEKAFSLNGFLAEDHGGVMQHQLFHQSKQSPAIFLNNVHPLHLAGNGHDAKALLIGVLLLEQNAQIDLFIAQERERVAVIDHLRAQNRKQLALEILFPEMLFFLAQVVKIHFLVAAGRQIFQCTGIVFIAVFLQLGRFGHNGRQLLLGGHIRLVFPLFLFASHQVGPLLQRADAHHEKLIQVGAVNGQKLYLLGQRDIFVLAKDQDPAVKIQPAQFPVDKDVLLIHVVSPFLQQRRLPLSTNICKVLPGLHDPGGNPRNIDRIFHMPECTVLLPVVQDCPRLFLPDAGQSAERVQPGCIQIDPGGLDHRFGLGCLPCVPLERDCKPEHQCGTGRRGKKREQNKALFFLCGSVFFHCSINLPKKKVPCGKFAGDFT